MSTKLGNARRIAFGDMAIYVSNLFILPADDDYSDELRSRTEAIRRFFLDICFETDTRVYSARVSALEFTTELISLISCIQTINNNFSMPFGDGEFEIFGSYSSEGFSLYFSAGKEIEALCCTRDELLLFFCELLSEVCCAMKTNGLQLGRLLSKFPALSG
jgi:hypothetical protein